MRLFPITIHLKLSSLRSLCDFKKNKIGPVLAKSLLFLEKNAFSGGYGGINTNFDMSFKKKKH
jgi:hypothetical protein